MFKTISIWKDFLRIFSALFLVILISCHKSENVSHDPKVTNLQEFVRPNCNSLVLVGGCFDILHKNHVNFLRSAKTKGDYLVVALESDEFIVRKKRRYPISNQRERADILSNLACVDEVILLPYLNGYEDYLELVRRIKPDVIGVTTPDSQLENKTRMAKITGSKVIIVNSEVNDKSTSKIIDKIRTRKSEKILFSGRVVKGKQLARQLGVPTLNVKYANQGASLEEGVHRCYIGYDEKIRPGICYYDFDRPDLIEAHVIDENISNPPEEVSLEIVEFLREKIDSPNDLQSQIDLDLLMGKSLFEGSDLNSQVKRGY
jgi:FAD synthetase